MLSNPRLRYLRFFPASAVILAIWFLSSQSTLPVPQAVFGMDKVAHFIAYAVLSFSVSLCFPQESFRKAFWRTAVAIFLITVLYGALDEFHQSFVPGRDTSVWDWLADVVGAGVGVIGSWLINIRKRSG